MEQQRLNYLFQQYRAKVLTEPEDAEWLAFMSEPEADALLEVLAKEEWNQTDWDARQMDADHALKIYEFITTQPQRRSARVFGLWSRIAAVVLVFIVLALFYFNHRPDLKADARANHIVPGKTQATLTLANGKKIALSETDSGELAQESGVVISKTADGQIVYAIVPGKASEVMGKGLMNSLSTANGETYRVRLPDGTVVWLNAASTLRYPVSFNGLSSRNVELAGEGYFEVAKDKMHPFVVTSGLQKVKVLGTHFNVNAYGNEPAIRTTLLEGSVQLNDQVVLKPNEQAVFSSSGIKVMQVTADSFVDWKSGVFSFENEGLSSIMRKVSRWYNVDIDYQEGALDKQTYSGTISRAQDISEVLHVLEETGGLNFKIEGRKVVVRK